MPGSSISEIKFWGLVRSCRRHCCNMNSCMLFQHCPRLAHQVVLAPVTPSPSSTAVWIIPSSSEWHYFGCLSATWEKTWGMGKGHLFHWIIFMFNFFHTCFLNHASNRDKRNQLLFRAWSKLHYHKRLRCSWRETLFWFWNVDIFENWNSYMDFTLFSLFLKFRVLPS